MASQTKSERPNRRRAAAEERRQAILEAALLEFAERGFAAARLDDVARRAGVAKGTIYLLAKDKSDLLQQVVLGKISPLFERVNQPIGVETLGTLDQLRTLLKFFRAEVLGTNRKRVAQVMIKEAGRFPEIAEFHYREVVSKLIALVAALLERARREGLLRSEAYARMPQLAVAPLVMALIWDANFSSFAPLDVDALLAAHFEAMFGAPLSEETNP